MSNDIFVSYRRKNVDFVKQLVSALEAQGKSLWVDWDDIPPGVASFTNEIERGIDSAHIFLAVLSPDYLQSEHCLSELQHASKLNKRIIPIVHEKIDGNPIPKAVQLINWIYFIPHAGQSNDFYTAVDNLIHAIETDYDHAQAHTRHLQRAIEWSHANKNNGFLLRGEALKEAETWLSQASGKDPEPAPLHTEFILASRRGEAQRQRRLLVGTGILLAFAVIALIIAVQQYFVATRRADETLSVLIANDALNALSASDPLTAVSRIYHANTFLDNPPDAVQSILQRIAFQPAPRYVRNGAPPLPADVGTQIQINDDVYLQQDSSTELSIRNNDDSIQTNLRLFTNESRDDSLIHPNVMDNIQDILNNSFSTFGVGYDISPDGSIVAMGREGVGLIVWSNDAEANIVNTYTDHDLVIDNAQFTEDGRYLITKASTQQMINFTRREVEYFIWDTSTWDVVQRVTTFDNTYNLLAISEDGRYLLFYRYGSNALTVWDALDVTSAWQAETFDFVQDLAFTADGQHLVVSSVVTQRMAPPNTIRIYTTETGNLLGTFFGVDSNRIIGLPILRGSDPDTLRFINDDGIINNFSITNEADNPLGTIEDLTFISGVSENGRYVASENFDPAELIVYDLDTLEAVGTVPIIGFVRNGSISNNGQYVAYTSADPDTNIATLFVYEVSTQTVVARFNNVASDFVVRVHLFSTDNHFVYVDTEHTVHLIDTETWQETQQLTGFLDQVNDMEYLADVNRLAVSGTSGSLMVWDTATETVTFQLDNIGNTANVALSPTGDILATGNEDGQIRVWQMFSADEALNWIEENRAIVPLSCADRVKYGLEPCE